MIGEDLGRLVLKGRNWFMENLILKAKNGRESVLTHAAVDL